MKRLLVAGLVVVSAACIAIAQNPKKATAVKETKRAASADEDIDVRDEEEGDAEDRDRDERAVKNRSNVKGDRGKKNLDERDSDEGDREAAASDEVDGDEVDDEGNNDKGDTGKRAAKATRPTGSKAATRSQGKARRADPDDDDEAPAAKPAFKDLKSRVSYTIGLNVGNSLKAQQLDVDLEVVMQGIQDALAGDSLMTEKEIQEVTAELQSLMSSRFEAEAEAQKADGEKFLAENKSKKGVKSTKTGLQYKVLAPGDGPSPKATDTVVVHYKGSFIDGTEFASSHEQGEPTTLPLNRFIKGWTEALQLMKTGAKWQLFIPYNLAYGEVGRPPKIPPYAALVFEVELLDIAAGDDSAEPESEEE